LNSCISASTKNEYTITYSHCNSFTGLKAKENLPSLQNLQKLWENTTSMEIFCNNFLACVVRKNEWKDMIKIKTVKEISTITDEAFALLILENIWDEWIKMDAIDYLKRQKE